MKGGNIRAHLRRACEEVEHVCESVGAAEVDDRFEGIAEQLRYVADHNPADPEALVYPERGALDTIQHRLDVIVERTDDDDLAHHLGRARAQLLLAITSLDERWRAQHELPDEE